jgi:fibronectin type 3 domain-containing protein
MYNEDAVAGFQFEFSSDLDGFMITGISGGSAEDAGFQLSSNSGTALGFSLTGATIPAGLGLLATIEVDLGADPNGFIYMDEAIMSNDGGEALDFDIFDELMVGTPPYVDVSLINVTESSADVYISSTTSIAGFQFDLASLSDGFTLTDAFSGLADDAGFEVSSNASGTVVGFSLTGATIPPSDDILVSLEYDFSGSYALIGLDDVTFSDSNALAIDFGVSSEDYVLGELPPVPSSPSNLVATLSNMINVSLSWDASEYTEFYTVYRDGQSITNTELLSFNDNALDYETSYVYWVTASNLMGESDPSSDVGITTDSEPFDAVPPGNLVAEAGDAQVQLSWSPPSGGGGGSFPECPDGSAEYVDCAGTCFNNSDCASGGYDCCVDDGNCSDIDYNGQIVDWLGDGYCDDGTWGMVFICDEYGNDCGDCGIDEDPLNVCDGDVFECTCDEGINNFNVGITDLDGDGTDDDCFDVYGDGSVLSNYFYLNWDGCSISDIYWGVNDVFENGGNFGNFSPGLILRFYLAYYFLYFTFFGAINIIIRLPSNLGICSTLPYSSSS